MCWFGQNITLPFLSVPPDPETACISELISIHNDEINSFHASVKRNDIESMMDNFLPFIGQFIFYPVAIEMSFFAILLLKPLTSLFYIGNGHIGLEISSNSWLMLRNNSILSVPLKVNILVALRNEKMPSVGMYLSLVTCSFHFCYFLL